MTGTNSWRDLLGHDGVVVIDLALRPTAKGGPKRELSSGYKADWTWPDESEGAGVPPVDQPRLPVRAPIDVVDPDRRCIRPGERGIVHAHPFDPELWSAIPIGSTVQLCRGQPSGSNGAVVIGEGTIIDTIDLPDHPVPLRFPDRPLRPGQAILVHIQR